MQIQVRTDNNIPSDARLEEHARDAAQAALGRFTDRITRIEFHLSDENGAKEGGDILCNVEVRIAGYQPAGTSHHAPHAREAIAGALKKAASVLETLTGKEQAARR